MAESSLSPQEAKDSAILRMFESGSAGLTEKFVASQQHTTTVGFSLGEVPLGERLTGELGDFSEFSEFSGLTALGEHCQGA